MQSVFIELTKYIFAFLMAFYVLSAYRGAIIHKEEKRKGIYIQQYIIIFAIHFLGYYVLYLMKGETRYIGFYFVQLIYLIIFIAFYYILYQQTTNEAMFPHSRLTGVFHPIFSHYRRSGSGNRGVYQNSLAPALAGGYGDRPNRSISTRHRHKNP